MRNLNIRGFAVAAFVAAGAVLAGCSGGGVKSLPPTPSSGQTVTTSMTIMIGGAGVQSATRHGETIPANNSKSIVIKYVGDPNPASAPTNPFNPGPPPTAPTASGTPINLVVAPAAGANCTPVGSALQCTLTGVTLVVGVEDLYILDYDGTNGTGNLIYGSVSTLQVNSNGTLTAPGTTTPVVAPNTLGGNVSATGATISLTGGVTITPNAAPLVTASPFPLSGAVSVSAKDANGNAITGALAPITVTSGDVSGNTCLVYQKAGTSNPTACPFPAAGTAASATVSNTADQLFVQYNNAPMLLAGFKLTAAQPAPSASPATTTTTVTFTPASFLSSAQANNGGITNFGNSVFVSTGSGTFTAVAQVAPFTFSKGALSAGTALPGTATGGGAANVNALAIGADNNLWWTDTKAGANQFIGVYAFSQQTGSTVLKGAVAETADFNGQVTAAATLNGIASYAGYIWAIDNVNDLIRVDPAQFVAGVVGSNAATANAAVIIAKAGNAGALPTAFASTGVAAGGMFAVPGVGLYVPTNKGTIVKITPNTTVAATSATLVPALAAGFVESPSVGALVNNGVVLGSDNNIWTSSTSAAYPYEFVPQGATSIGQAAINAAATKSFGGVNAGGLENYIYTLGGAAGGVLAYTSTNGATNGVIASAAAGCIPAAVNVGGEGIIGISNYLIHTGTTTGLCIAVP